MPNVLLLLPMLAGALVLGVVLGWVFARALLHEREQEVWVRARSWADQEGQQRAANLVPGAVEACRRESFERAAVVVSAHAGRVDRRPELEAHLRGLASAPTVGVVSDSPYVADDVDNVSVDVLRIVGPA